MRWISIGDLNSNRSGCDRNLKSSRPIDDRDGHHLPLLPIASIRPPTERSQDEGPAMPLNLIFKPDSVLLHSADFHRRRRILRVIAFACSLLNWSSHPLCRELMLSQFERRIDFIVFSVCAVIPDSSWLYAVGHQCHFHCRRARHVHYCPV
jgi:hypothetical protein